MWLRLQDFRQAAQDFDFGVTATSLVGDDRILQCALSQAQQLHSQRPHQQDDMSSTSAQAGVLLLSNDKVMQLKVGIACAEALWPQPAGTLSTLLGQTAAVSARTQQTIQILNAAETGCFCQSTVGPTNCLPAVHAVQPGAMLMPLTGACMQAQANGMAVAGLSDLRHLSTALPAAGALHTQSLCACLVRMLQCAGVTPPWLASVAAANSTGTCQPLAAAADNPVLARVSGQYSRGSSMSGVSDSSIGSPTKAEKQAQHRQEEQQRQQAAVGRHHQRQQEDWQLQKLAAAKKHMQRHRAGQQQQQQLSVAELSAAASSFLAFLRLTLASQVEGWFLEDLGEFGLDVMMHRPPWNDLQFVEVLNNHWESTVKVCAALCPNLGLLQTQHACCAGLALRGSQGPHSRASILVAC